MSGVRADARKRRELEDVAHDALVELSAGVEAPEVHTASGRRLTPSDIVADMLHLHDGDAVRAWEHARDHYADVMRRQPTGPKFSRLADAVVSRLKVEAQRQTTAAHARVLRARAEDADTLHASATRASVTPTRRHGDGPHACGEACEHAACDYDRRTDGRLYVGPDRRTFDRRK